MAGLARFEITQDQIAQVVAAFYAQVRVDPTLGPVFAAHVTDWPAHEAKIERFWRNAILSERVYDGNPMAVHMAAHEVKGGHFDIWLTLFDRVVTAELPHGVATRWSHLAHRIGRGLRMGVEDLRSPSGVPSLHQGCPCQTAISQTDCTSPLPGLESAG